LLPLELPRTPSLLPSARTLLSHSLAYQEEQSYALETIGKLFGLLCIIGNQLAQTQPRQLIDRNIVWERGHGVTSFGGRYDDEIELEDFSVNKVGLNTTGNEDVNEEHETDDLKWKTLLLIFKNICKRRWHLIGDRKGSKVAKRSKPDFHDEIPTSSVLRSLRE
jgi:hypothetical protein